MTECEVNRLFVKDGVKQREWVARPVTELVSGHNDSIRCVHCQGAVRVHKQQVNHGPQDHVEHLARRDSEGCRGGHHYCGTHSMSSEPIA
jgi:hypothetical protein